MNDDVEEDEIKIDDRSSRQTVNPTVRYTYEADSAEVPALLRNVAARDVLGVFLAIIQRSRMVVMRRGPICRLLGSMRGC